MPKIVDGVPHYGLKMLGKNHYCLQGINLQKKCLRVFAEDIIFQHRKQRFALSKSHVARLITEEHGDMVEK